MQTSRLLISTLTAAGIVGLTSLAIAQTVTTPPASGTVTTPGTTTTITPPSVTTTTETEAERLNRERMNAPAPSIGSSPAMVDRPMDSTARRDANGNLVAQADRN